VITRAQLEELFEAQGGKKSPRQVIPGFDLIRKLGEGGMGATYLARQVSMDRLVALRAARWRGAPCQGGLGPPDWAAGTLDCEPEHNAVKMAKL
jgi:hypothetical protein